MRTGGKSRVDTSAAEIGRMDSRRDQGMQISGCATGVYVHGWQIFSVSPRTDYSLIDAEGRRIDCARSSDTPIHNLKKSQ
jgi:hypothetical protein